MIILIYLLLAISVGYSAAKITQLIDYSFNEGNIFDFYYLFLLEKVKPRYPKLVKPLGLCPKCMSAWICLIIFLSFYFVTGLPIPFLFISEAVTVYEMF